MSEPECPRAKKLAKAFGSDNVEVTFATDNDPIYSKESAIVRLRVYSIKKFLPIIDFLSAEQDRIHEERGGSIRISRVYAHKNGKFGYYWEFAVVAEESSIDSTVEDVVRVLELVKRFNVAPVVVDPVEKSNGGSKREERVAVAQPRVDALQQSAGGTVIDGSVVSMPLVGVTADRNKPKAPMLTPGKSSKGAHLIAPKKEPY